jgi:hypothetical protein
MTLTNRHREGVSRRSVVVSAGGALLLVACGRHAASSGEGIAKVAATADSIDFLHLSQALTGHADLDATTARRLVDAFAGAAPAMKALFASLGALARPGASPADMLAAATAVGLRPVASAIVAAWYTGTVGEGVKARTVSYRDALMQRTVADALLPPTYILGGPAWWTAPPPEVGVPARATHAVPITPAASAGSSR